MAGEQGGCCLRAKADSVRVKVHKAARPLHFSFKFRFRQIVVQEDIWASSAPAPPSEFGFFLLSDTARSDTPIDIPPDQTEQLTVSTSN